MRYYVLAAFLMLGILLGCTAEKERQPIGDLAVAPSFTSLDQGMTEAKQLNRPLLLEFYTDW